MFLPRAVYAALEIDRFKITLFGMIVRDHRLWDRKLRGPWLGPKVPKMRGQNSMNTPELESWISTVRKLVGVPKSGYL